MDLLNLIELLDQLSFSLIQFKYKLLVIDLNGVWIKVYIDGVEVEKLQVKRRAQDIRDIESYLSKKYLGYE